MSFVLRANTMDDLSRTLLGYGRLRIVSVEQRIAVGSAYYEVTLGSLDEQRVIEAVPLPLRARSCRRGHVSGYTKVGPSWRCIECRRIDAKYYGKKRKRKRAVHLVQRTGS